MKHMKESSAPILSRLLSELVSGPFFPVRRGASFGLAGCVKGFGIACLKSSDIMAALEEAAQSKSPEARQGALFAFETLSESLGLLFEPYVIRILPYLLRVSACFLTGTACTSLFWFRFRPFCLFFPVSVPERSSEPICCICIAFVRIFPHAPSVGVRRQR